MAEPVATPSPDEARRTSPADGVIVPAAAQQAMTASPHAFSANLAGTSSAASPSPAQQVPAFQAQPTPSGFVQPASHERPVPLHAESHVSPLPPVIRH
jgi:hypothetical protein